MSRIAPFLSCALLACISACSHAPYVAKPINTETLLQKLDAKDPHQPAFEAFLVSQGYEASTLPLKTWDADALTYCALFFHPALDVAKAQLRAAEVRQKSSGIKQLPNLNANIGTSDNANQDKSAHMYSLGIDIPIETANKSAIKIENAQHLSQAAKLEIAQTAWQLRQQVFTQFEAYQQNNRELALLESELALRQQIVQAIQKRVNVGEASRIELSQANLQLQTAQATQMALQQNKTTLLSQLAASVGLSPRVLANMPLADDNASIFSHDALASTDVQKKALLNRLDIRIALERYAAAEAKVKLEIANQYPDISLSPTYAYEFGNSVWSLGISSLLALLHQNKHMIAEAETLRDVEAAQFEALQNQVIAEANIANAKRLDAQAALKSQLLLAQQQQQYTARMVRNFEAGEIDRIELNYAKLEAIRARMHVLQAAGQLKAALLGLENALQLPLNASRVTPQTLENVSSSQ